MKQEQASKDIRVIDIQPRVTQAVKPAELIQVTGHQELTLNARRCITILWHAAHQQGIDEGKDYVIEIDDLKTDKHKGYEIVEDAIISLMKTLLTVKMSDGKTRRVQFLGGNDLDDPNRPAGVLHYSFDKRLVEILKDSAIWGKIVLPVLMALSSKYAVSLYEHLCQWSGLSYKNAQQVTLDEFRNILGIENGKYEKFGALNKHVIKNIVLEINALAPFNVSLLPIKEGKRVAHIAIGWAPKNTEELEAAQAELGRPKIGRKARISGAAEYSVSNPTQSINRLIRNSRKNS